MSHLIVTTDSGKLSVLYIGESGAEADKAYDGAKNGGAVSHFQLHTPIRKRDGDKASAPTVIREHVEPKKPAKAEK